MANNPEMSKYEALLRSNSEKEYFQTLFKRCHLLSKNQPIQATNGELMAVCAYRTGRRFAGSAATREACANLGCIDLKKLDKVNDIVSKLLPSKGPSTTLTVVSLAQKYNLPPEKRQQVQAVENDLYYSLPEKMREDERVVCAIFAVVSKRLGLKSYNKWISAEAKKYELDMNEVKQLILTIENDYGQRIEERLRLYENTGTSSTGQKVVGRNVMHSRSASLALKRPAPEEEPGESTPTKKQKVESATAFIASQLQDEFSPDKAFPFDRRSSGKSNVSYRGATTDGEEVEDQLLEDESEPPATSDSEESEGSTYVMLPLSEALQLDWRALAQYRQRSISRQNINPAVKTRAVFVDRTLWG